MTNLKQIINNLLTKRVLIGLCLGAIGGYLYGYYVGCSGGTCPLTSSPWRTAAYFALFGVMFAYPDKTRKKDETTDQ